MSEAARLSRREFLAQLGKSGAANTLAVSTPMTLLASSAQAETAHPVVVEGSAHRCRKKEQRSSLSYSPGQMEWVPHQYSFLLRKVRWRRPPLGGEGECLCSQKFGSHGRRERAPLSLSCCGPLFFPHCSFIPFQ